MRVDSRRCSRPREPAFAPFPENPEPDKPKRNISPLMIVLPVLAVLIVAGGFFGWRWYAGHVVRARELMESATSYLDAGSYREAEKDFWSWWRSNPTTPTR